MCIRFNGLACPLGEFVTKLADMGRDGEKFWTSATICNTARVYQTADSALLKAKVIYVCVCVCLVCML